MSFVFSISESKKKNINKYFYETKLLIIFSTSFNNQVGVEVAPEIPADLAPLIMLF